MYLIVNELLIDVLFTCICTIDDGNILSSHIDSFAFVSVCDYMYAGIYTERKSTHQLSESCPI